MSDTDDYPLRFRFDSEHPQGETYSVEGDGYVILVLGTKKPTPKVSRLRRLKNRLGL